MVVICLCFVNFIAVVFFFSSRRRHTRFDCDWSSDVCSSDLPTLAEFVGGPGVPTEPCRAGAGVLFAKRVQLAAQRPLPIQRLGRRPPREAEVDRKSVV